MGALCDLHQAVLAEIVCAAAVELRPQFFVLRQTRRRAAVALGIGDYFADFLWYGQPAVARRAQHARRRAHALVRHRGHHQVDGVAHHVHLPRSLLNRIVVGGKIAWHVAVVAPHAQRGAECVHLRDHLRSRGILGHDLQIHGRRVGCINAIGLAAAGRRLRQG